MTTAEAMRQIDRLAEDGYLIWLTRRPRLIGGGWTVRIIETGGAERWEQGRTIGEAIERVLPMLGRELGVSA